MLETRRVELGVDGATLELVANAEWGAGVHVLAEAFRPLARAAKTHEPVRAVGLAWVATDPAPHRLAVTLDVPATVTPRQSIAVPVHAVGVHGRAFVTVAAVDEGILQLTHFTSPDPVAALLGRTRFGMDLRDDYGRLLDEQRISARCTRAGIRCVGGAGLPVTSTKGSRCFTGRWNWTPRGMRRFRWICRISRVSCG